MADRDMSGALFKNDRKEKPSHADYRGDVTINGEKFWLNGWVKETKDGKKYLSLSARPVEEASTKPKQAARAPFDDSDSIPFNLEWR